MTITPPENDIGQPFAYYEVKARGAAPWGDTRGGRGWDASGRRSCAAVPHTTAAAGARPLTPRCAWPAPPLLACPQVCVKGTDTCFTRTTDGTQGSRPAGARPAGARPADAPATTFEYTVTDAACPDTATNCLRSDTDYTCWTTAVKAGGAVKSLESDPKDFRTPSHRRAPRPARPAAPRAARGCRPLLPSGGRTGAPACQCRGCLHGWRAVLKLLLAAARGGPAAHAAGLAADHRSLAPAAPRTLPAPQRPRRRGGPRGHHQRCGRRDPARDRRPLAEV